MPPLRGLSILDSTSPSPTTITTTYDAGGNRQVQDRVGPSGSRSDVFTTDGANRLIALSQTIDDGSGSPTTLSSTLLWDDLGGVVTDHRGSSLVRGADGQVQQLVDHSGDSVSIQRDPLGRPAGLLESFPVPGILS